MHAETLNLEQAADLLKAEADTVMQLARSGKLPGAKIGKAWVFLRCDVLAFLRKEIDESTAARRGKTAHPPILGTVTQKPAHGRFKPRPVLPDLKD
jgi:excisionase family DNA binding protein